MDLMAEEPNRDTVAGLLSEATTLTNDIARQLRAYLCRFFT